VKSSSSSQNPIAGRKAESEQPARIPAGAAERQIPRNKRPFFIVGNPRSGTTLLRFILSTHSRIYIPEETGFVPHLVGYLGHRLTRQETEKLVRKIGRMNREWSQLVTDFATFYEQLAEPTLTEILDALYRIRICNQGAVRWGDKGPSYVRCIPQLDRIFPQALYIHLIRDGRDSTISAMKKWRDQFWYFDTYYLMKNWARNIRAGQSAGQNLGHQRYLEIRYEQLVSEPEPTIRQVCDFLDESFEPAMLDHTGLARQLVGPTGHFEVEQPVTRRTVGNWRRNMPLFDQKVALRVGGRELRKLGYETPDLPRMTLRERVQFAYLATRFLVNDTARQFLYAVGWLKMSSAKKG